MDLSSDHDVIFEGLDGLERVLTDGAPSAPDAQTARDPLTKEFFDRVEQVESGGRHDRVSPEDAIGRMQLMPGTARDLGVDPHDPDQNREGGERYYRQMYERYGDLRTAAMAYNWGRAMSMNGWRVVAARKRCRRRPAIVSRSSA